MVMRSMLDGGNPRAVFSSVGKTHEEFQPVSPNAVTSHKGGERVVVVDAMGNEEDEDEDGGHGIDKSEWVWCGEVLEAWVGV